MLAAQDEASAKLHEIRGNERGPMGLTPDHIKNSPEYKEARAAYEIASQKVRVWAHFYTKNFKKEILAERRAKKGY